MENKVSKEHIVHCIPSFNRFHRTARGEHLTPSDIRSELQIAILNKNAIFHHGKLSRAIDEAEMSFAWCDVWAKGVMGAWCLTSSWWRHHRQRIEHLQSQKSIPALLKTIYNWTLLKKRWLNWLDLTPLLKVQWSFTAREELEICKSCTNHLPDVQVNQIEVGETQERLSF